MKRNEIDFEQLSPVMKQYVELKNEYSDCILFFRLGDFYEMFFEDATEMSKVLEITLTGKQAGLKEKIPMAGIPHHAANTYIERLINLGYKVAIAEQITDPKESKGVVERDVVQVITKGTLLDDHLLNKDNNYIASVYDYDYCYSFCYADISTGEISVKLIEKENDKLINKIMNNKISEVIVNDLFNRNLVNELRERYNVLVSINNDVYQKKDYDFLLDEISDIRLVTNIKHLLNYLLNVKKGDLTHLQKPEEIIDEEYLLFDAHTKSNLELTETIRNKERTYSLLWLLDKTKTAGGSRFLKRTIENPLRSKNKITRRYNYVESLLNNFIVKDELKLNLNNIYDLERLMGRINYGNLNGRDLIQLKNSLRLIPEISRLAKEINYDQEFIILDELYELIEESIYDEPPVSIKEGSLIKDGYHDELDELRYIRSHSKDFILEYETLEKEKTNIKSLKIGFNKVFGYYIEIPKGSVNLVKDEFNYERKQTLTTGERFTTPLLKEKENIILNAEEKIINLEYLIFMDIREKVKQFTREIQYNAKLLSELDFLQSLATVAEENKYIKPIISDKNIVNIKAGRHPVVEKVNPNGYVPNDINMDEYTDILLITGPNMAGKSTYLRQLAIIVIMAQIGSFVPADYCEYFLVDKIFTRIGASDDLVAGESTFMVEMKEANYALSNATENSLILFDELGRGTATYDGMSLAQAILEYIHNELKSKTIFSTHYHELTNLSKTLERLTNIHVSAIENDGEITFLHKIKKGPVDKSYGIHVASLANLDNKIINRAKDILQVYEKTKNKKGKFVQTSFDLDNKKEDKQEEKIKERIERINPLEMTPIEAINFLYELKKVSKRK